MRMTAVIAAAGLVLGLGTACDPTTGRPPAKDEAAPAFEVTIATVTTEELGDSWHAGCPVGPSDLRRVRVDYWGYDGGRHRGDLIVHADVAETVGSVFEQIYDGRFQIRRIHPITVYGASDAASMDANNTSAFNCRKVTGGSGWSEHAYGTAIDINPQQNPYVTSGGTVLPESGRYWVEREPKEPGMITPNGVVRRSFAAVGWFWGGEWSDPTDYQHMALHDR